MALHEVDARARGTAALRSAATNLRDWLSLAWRCRLDDFIELADKHQ